MVAVSIVWRNIFPGNHNYFVQVIKSSDGKSGEVVANRVMKMMRYELSINNYPLTISN